MRTALLAVLVLVAAIFSIGPGDIGGVAIPEGIYTAEGVEQPRIEIAGGYLRVMPVDLCPSCSVFTDRPFLASSINEEDKAVHTSMGLINESGVSAVEGATIFVYLERPDGDVAKSCRIYTGGNGSASFDYGTLCDEGCTIKMVFCCSNPVELACVLSTCLGDPYVGAYTDLPACEGYEGAWPDKATVNGADIELYPTVDVVSIPPKVEAPGFTFAFTLCFPLLVIFGFLGAAMYAAGRDPFAMFSFYTPRFTRGAERPIAGKGYTLPGSSLGMVSMRIKDFATGQMSLGDVVNMMEQSPLLQKETGVKRVRMAAAGRGGAGETTREVGGEMERARGLGAGGMPAGEARAMGMPVVGGYGAGVAPELMEGGMAGIGAGTAMMAMLGIFLRFSNAPWITAGLSQAALGLAKEWQQERLANFAQQNMGGLMERMSIRFDQSGNVTRIEYTDPETGEKTTITGVDKCAEFIQNNILVPQAALASVNANRAAELHAQFNNMMGREEPVAGARTMLSAERAAEGLPAGADSALAALADPNTTMADKKAAFEILSQMDWGGKPDVLIAAFVAATEGMTYTQFSDFVKGSEAGTVFRELTVNAQNLRGSGDGNMLAAIAMASERLENIRDSRPEGLADKLNLGAMVAALDHGVAACSDERFAFRDGTEAAAGRMAAMGLSEAALGITVSLEGLNIAKLDPEMAAEIEAATHEGQVNVSELSGDARTAIVELAKDQLGMDAGREIKDRMDSYDDISRLSYGMVMLGAGPAMSEALEASGVSGAIEPNGELAGTQRPEGLDSNKALELLRERGVDPDLARTLSEVGRVDAESNYLEQLGIVSNNLLAPPDPYSTLGSAPIDAGRSTESAEERAAAFRNALDILNDPLATEASKKWASEQISIEYERALAPLQNPNASEADAQRARTIVDFASLSDYQGWSNLLNREAEEAHTEQTRWERARDLVTALPEGVDLDASREDIAQALANATPEERARYEEAARAYAEVARDDAGTAAERARAESAIETIMTSSDPAARAEAADVLRSLSSISVGLQPQIDGLISRPPPEERTPDLQSTMENMAEALGTQLSSHYDMQRETRAASDPVSTTIGIINGISLDAGTERANRFLPSEGEGVAQALTDTRQSLEETQFRDNEMHIALLGNTAIDNFYANMDEDMRVAREAQARIEAEQADMAAAIGARAARDRMMGRTPAPPYSREEEHG